MSLISLHWAVIMGRVSTEPGKNEAHTVIQFYDSIGDCSTARDTVPRLQCFTELPEAYPIHHTDRPHVLAYERNTFLRAGLLSSRRQRACGGQRKICIQTWLFRRSSTYYAIFSF